MSEIVGDELYREVILDHFHSPRHRGRMEHPTVQVKGKNPLCGDELSLALKIEGGRITDSRHEAHGCSISQASASMMAEAIQSKTVREAKEFAAAFKNMMLAGGSLPEELDELKALEGVRQLPVRVKCALLAWNALLQALEEGEGSRDGPGAAGAKGASAGGLSIVSDPARKPAESQTSGAHGSQGFRRVASESADDSGEEGRNHDGR